MIRRLSLCAFLVAIAWPSGMIAAAEKTITKPSSANRVVHVFDFEERAFNQEPMPRHWIRAQDDSPKRPRPGFPPWNQAGFDFTVAASGEASVKLPTLGGSAAIELVPGALPVIPGGDYLISAHVRTDRLRHARARMVARYADAQLKPIPASEHASALIRTEGEWQTLSIRLPGEFPNAAWLTIDLELLQPDQFPAGARVEGNPAAVRDAEDVAGAAWFDDIVVQIAPVVSLYTPTDSGVVIGETAPSIHALVNDVVGDHMVATMRALNIDGEIVDEKIFDPAPSGGRLEWRPALESFGWWRIELDVFANGNVIASESRNLIWIPVPSNSFEVDRFGITLHEEEPSQASTLLNLLDAASVGAVEIPFWRSGFTRTEIADRIPHLTQLLEDLLSRQLRVSFALERLPHDLAHDQRLGESEIIPALLAGRDQWAPWLDEALTRFGQRVRRWRIGTLEKRRLPDPRQFAESFLIAAEPLKGSVLNPLPTLPWPIEIEPPPSLASAGLSMIWSPSLPSAAILDLATTWRNFKEVMIHIETSYGAGIDRRAASIDLARRAIRAWQATPERLTIAQPWSWRLTRDGEVAAEPTPAFAVWSRLSEHLRGRRVVGDLPIADGVVALVLDGEAGGAIVAWNEWAQPDRSRIRAYLSSHAVTVYDIFGNATVVDAHNGAHDISVGASPIFIEGVDAALARFRAGFSVEPAHIESTAERHGLELIVSNPWPNVMSGDLRIIEPAGWTFLPQTMSFTIAPGEQARFPVQVSFGVSEEAGGHLLRAQTRLVAGERYPAITVDAPIELSLSGVELIPSYQIRRESSGDSVIVTLLVINTGDEPTTLMTFAHAPGAKRQQAPISDLPPRGAAVRSFVFRHSADLLKNEVVQVGVIESAGLGRLTRRVMIE